MNAGPSQESVKMGVALTLLGATGASVMKDFNQVPQALNALVSWYMHVFYLVNKTSVLWCHHRKALHIYPCLLNKSLNLSNPHTSSWRYTPIKMTYLYVCALLAHLCVI